MRRHLLAGLLAVALPAFTSVANAQTKLTFFIWAGSNQGMVPMEVITAYRAAHPDVRPDRLAFAFVELVGHPAAAHHY